MNFWGVLGRIIFPDLLKRALDFPPILGGVSIFQGRVYFLHILYNFVRFLVGGGYSFIFQIFTRVSVIFSLKKTEEKNRALDAMYCRLYHRF